jgi:DNA polymerase III delta prime subunit
MKLNTHLIKNNFINGILNGMNETKTFVNMMYYGPPGSGKTTTATMFGEMLYNERSKLCVMNINASDERGVGVIRDKIMTFINTTTLSRVDGSGTPVKMVILDEVDYMVPDAQLGLSELMDGHKDIIFIFICNYLQKIKPQLMSRVLTVRFPVPSRSVSSHLPA